MSRGLGKVQTKLLEALHQHGEAYLDKLAYLAAGLIEDLTEEPPLHVAIPESVYKATARAVSKARAVSRRGLVETQIIGASQVRSGSWWCGWRNTRKGGPFE